MRSCRAPSKGCSARIPAAQWEGDAAAARRVEDYAARGYGSRDRTTPNDPLAAGLCLAFGRVGRDGGARSSDEEEGRRGGVGRPGRRTRHGPDGKISALFDRRRGGNTQRAYRLRSRRRPFPSSPAFCWGCPAESSGAPVDAARTRGPTTERTRGTPSRSWSREAAQRQARRGARPPAGGGKGAPAPIPAAQRGGGPLRFRTGCMRG